MIPHYQYFKKAFLANVRIPNVEQLWNDAVARIRTNAAAPTDNLFSVLNEYSKREMEDESAHELMSQVTHVVMFEAYGRKIIQPTDALVKMLEQTSPTLPLSDIRFPFKSICIWLEHLKYRGLHCIYVIQSVGNDTKNSTIMCGPVRARKQTQEDPSLSFDMYATKVDYPWAEQRCVDQFLLDEGYLDRLKLEKEYSNDEVREVLRNTQYVTNLIFNIALYLSSPVGRTEAVWEQSRQPSYSRPATHFAERARRELERSKFVLVSTAIIGQSISLPSPVATGTGAIGSGCEKATHWRRGHWTHVWIGPRGSPEAKREPRWIKPILVNAGVTEEPKYAVYKVAVTP